MINKSVIQKNFLFIGSLYKNKWGGVEKWMFEIGKGLRENGHKVIYCGRPESRYVQMAMDLSFKSYNVNFRTDFNPLVSYSLRKITKKENIDLIVVGQEKDLRLLAMSFLMVKRPAIVIRKGLSLIKNRKRFKIIYDKLVDAIITPSKGLSDELLNLLPWLSEKKINVIHNGISIPDPINKGIFRGENNIPDDTFLISVIGRFSIQKGQELFIESLKKIKDKLDNTKIIFVGDGEEKSRYIELIKKYDLSSLVTLIGHRWDIGAILADTDLLVHPSLYEGMPNTLLEALSYGTPVLATNIPGVDEIDMSEKVMELVEPGNSDALADKTVMLKSNPEYRIEMGRKGKAHVSKYFTLESMQKSVNEVLMRTIKNSE